MPRAAPRTRTLPPLPLLPLLLLLLLPLTAVAQSNNTLADSDSATSVILIASNDTIFDADNETLANGDHEPVVRKKRTFGDIVFRGLADVLGYRVARKPPEVAFPPPLAPVPGIDLPLQAAAAPAPAPAPAAATAPCGSPRAAPAPCRAQAPPPPPPKPRPPPPCPKPRAAPRPKPRPPPPPPPPPCAAPRANPTTAAPCAPPPPAPPAPAPKQGDNLETITSNLRLDFNFNRAPAGAAAASAPAEQAPADQQQQQEQEQELEQEPVAPVAIQPRAARLPPARARDPRVYVDAFVVRGGVARKVAAVDARHLDAQRTPLEDDYLVYDDEETQQILEDDYEDVQESRDRAKAVRDFGDAVDKFWQPKRLPKKKLAANDYRNVHFGDRGLADELRRRSDGETHQSLKRERQQPRRVSLPLPEAEPEDDAELTTTTEDPKRPLKPRVLPPTEHNPGQIDTVTVRVPPIYKERRPKKLNRERPESSKRRERPEPERRRRPEHSEREQTDSEDERDLRDASAESDDDADADGENSAWVERTERPAKRRRRRKQSRDKRSVEQDSLSAGDYDYYGNKLPISDEEKFFRGLTVPPPTKYAELARLEEASDDDHFLDDHERIREDPETAGEDERANDDGRADDSGRADDAGRADDSGRSSGEDERTGEAGRADERERTDRLSPNARVHETASRNQYVRARGLRVEAPRA